MLGHSLLALAASASCVAAQAKGFNYASNGNTQDTFTKDINAQKGLTGASGFNSARLYTMIQDGTADTPISAIPAAIATKGTLLLGLWASAGQAAFKNEITALKSAIDQYGQDFADSVVGISVGSEDLYRDTYTSQVTNKDPNPGASPDTLAEYISKVRDTIKGTVLKDVPVGHVDTYTAYINGSNQALIDACDFLGMDAYPYYQTTQENSIDDAYDLFFSAYDQTKAAGGGSKPVWVTETGWPYKGDKSHLAVASVENAEKYWKTVGCALFGKTNVWWFTLADAGSSPAFGILGDSINNEPLFDLSCDDKSSSSSASSSKTSAKADSATSVKSVASATKPASSAKGVHTSSIATPIPSAGESGPSGSAKATATGSSGSGSSSESGSGSGSGYGSGSGSSSGNGSGAGSSGAPYPIGTGSMTTAAAGTGGVTTPSTPGATVSSFTGAANRHAEIGAGAMAVLGALGWLI